MIHKTRYGYQVTMHSNYVEAEYDNEADAKWHEALRFCGHSIQEAESIVTNFHKHNKLLEASNRFIEAHSKGRTV